MAFMESTFCSQWVNHLCVEGVFIDDFSLAWLVYCSIALCPGCLLSSLLKSCFLFCFLQTCCYQYIVWVLFQFGLVYVMKQKLCKCSHSFWLIDEKQTIVKKKNYVGSVGIKSCLHSWVEWTFFQCIIRWFWAFLHWLMPTWNNDRTIHCPILWICFLKCCGVDNTNPLGEADVKGCLDWAAWTE